MYVSFGLKNIFHVMVLNVPFDKNYLDLKLICCRQFVNVFVNECLGIKT